jgi:trimethylamine--corrinoid protein Co-methyltransferase
MRPSLRLMSDEDMLRVHEASVRILGSAGTHMDNDEAKALLLDAGAEQGKKKNVIRIPESIIEECIGKPPPSITLKGRGGERKVVLEGDQVHFNPGSAAMFIRDHETYDIRPPGHKDLVDFVKLTHMLEFMSMQSTALVVSDAPKEIGDLYRLFVVLLFSDKPVVTGAFDRDGVPLMNRMLDSLGQQDNGAPMAIFDVCPSPPLMWSDITCQNLLDCAELGLPAQIVTMPELGATAPATMAGAVVQGNAEFLTALVISQLKRKGAPVIYGGSSTTFDMRYATPRLGAIETTMTATALNQMGKFYSVPTHAYLALSDSKTVDAQAGLETSFGAVVGVLAGINNISGPGMLSSENCQSMEKLVIDNDICGQALRLGRGFDVVNETLAEELIAKVAPGGNYLATKHTVDWFRTETFFPSEVIDRQTAKKWAKDGAKDARMRAGEMIGGLLGSYKMQELTQEETQDLYDDLYHGAAKRGVKPDSVPKVL